MNPRESKEFGSEWKSQFNTIQAIAQIVAFSVELWTIRPGTWGHRYLMAWAIFGSLWPCLFGSFYGPHPRIHDLFMFWLASFGWLLVHRVAGIVRRHRGYQCHSRYWGASWFERGSGFASQRWARTFNALLAFVCGWSAVQLGSAPLGSLLMIGSVAKLFTDAMVYWSMSVRLSQMEDARLENEYYAEMLRERQR